MKRLNITLIFFLFYINYGNCQINENSNDTIILRNACLKAINEERLFVFDNSDRDVYKSSLEFILNDTTIYTLNYRGQFPIPTKIKREMGKMLPLGNELNCNIRTGKSYNIKLIKVCGDALIIKNTYYWYFASFIYPDCSMFILKENLPELKETDTFFYTHFLVDKDNHIYQIKVENCSGNIEK